MNYVAIKVTIWNRIRFDSKADMEKIIQTFNEDGIESVYDEDVGFIETFPKCETEGYIDPAENDGQSTVEVYAAGKLVWDNEQKEMKL